MKTPIGMLQSIVDMQKENYGYGIDTHMKLSVMAKEAEAVIKNHGVSHHVSDIVYYDHLQPNEFIPDGEKYEIVEVVPDGYILENEKTRRFWASPAQIASCR